LRFIFSYPDQLFWLVSIAIALTALFVYKWFFVSKQLKSIFIFRIFIFLILLLVYLNPSITRSDSVESNLFWNIYVDKSLSMSYHSSPSKNSLIPGIDDIIKRLNKKEVPIKIYNFGTEIDTNWVLAQRNINDASTNLGKVLNHMNQDNGYGVAGSLIITDGQANQGINISSINLDKNKPIHIIGIGDNIPLVDVSIVSINAPPVIIKGENAEIEVLLSSFGVQNQRVNVTIHSKDKLLGSKTLTLSGEGSIDKIRFMINPDKTGEVEYKIQVNALPDEVNILNNKQILPIQVLKNEYKISIITGAPNFNTNILKNIFNENKNFQIDHYFLSKNGYIPPLKNFWDTKYDLILFDNHPVKENKEDWKSFLRIFAKKILSQKTSFAIFLGNDVDESSLKPFLNLMDMDIKKPLMQLESNYNWKFSKNWEAIFPFQNNYLTDKKNNEHPPLSINTEIDTLNSEVLASFQISDVTIPLILIAEKDPLRYLAFSSPDLHKLFYKAHNNDYKNLTSQMLNTLFSWLMKTGNGKDFYFRSGKNIYQQGEKVSIIGRPIKESERSSDAMIHIFSNGKKINSKPLAYDNKTGFYKGQFWASQSGKLDYNIELLYGEKSLIVSEGSVLVQESQIELNNVFLNEKLLQKLSDATNGSFYNWTDRLLVLNDINKKSNKEIFQSKIILHDSRLLFFIIIFVLTLEWLFRRKNGFM
tara:strand:- start:153 stop:2258 length:2106 start_codon:yes stop_codon:yes gene_type:complete